MLTAIVAIADSEMSGILTRYYMDFLWIMIIPTFMTLCQLIENYSDKKAISWIVAFVLIAGIFGLTYEFAVAIKSSGMLDDNPAVYYTLRSLMALR